ncbi:transposable element Tcb1 transposase [Trichonephila clavipes]|nr:transposable element Tcb1 transposase [Trichonephila clavipes]
MPGKRARRHLSQLSKFERDLIIGMKTAGWLTRRIAGQVDRSECDVRNCWEQWTREGTHPRKTGSGATRKTTRRKDRRIVRQALVDPTVTRSTIRADWCQKRSTWNVTDWQKVVFWDEPRFVWGTDDNHVRLWRWPGERYNALPHFSTSDCPHSWCNGLGATAYDSRSPLIVMCGTLTGHRYVDDILRPHVGPFLNGLPGAIFQKDNALPHTARVAQDFLRHFQTILWPARSLDLSLVEHVWDQLK